MISTLPGRAGRKDVMDPYEQPLRRLHLDGAFNVRDLGGYPTVNGGFTNHRRFLRADGLGRLSKWDAKLLRSYGVSAVLDLRDEAESQQLPNVSLGKDVLCANVPLLGFNAADMEQLEKMFAADEFDLTYVYGRILENYEGIRACFKFIADAPEGCVLFHCAAGKDRTGILAMLLLSLAGVDKWDIVSDYVQSWPNLMRDEAFREDWLDSSKGTFRQGMRSDPQTISYAIDLIDYDHGGVEGYLLECGVSDDEVALVRQRLLA